MAQIVYNLYKKCTPFVYNVYTHCIHIVHTLVLMKNYSFDEHSYFVYEAFLANVYGFKENMFMNMYIYMNIYIYIYSMKANNFHNHLNKNP